ncbi:MAG: translation initiation factor IF-2, partial [Phycisphaerales bacterium]
MANKRIFEIAKELGIKSKAIVEKCHAEGIPADVIKNHMSTVSIGLEQTVREWFAGGEAEESPHTAVEQAEKVDLEKARQIRKKKAIKAAEAESESEDGGGDTTTAVAEPPARARKATPASPSEPEPEKKINVPAGLSAEPPKDKEPDEKPAAAASAPEQGEDRAAAEQAGPAPKAGDKAEDKAEGKASNEPPRMNVPTRPKTIAPAGPQLEKKSQIKLSGPKVVRVEAPEQVEAPRRRPPRGPGGGFAGGGGAGVGVGGGEGRPPRGAGNTRRRGDGRQPGGDVGEGRGWTAADLAEREARLQRSGGYLKQRQQQMRTSANAGQTPAKIGGKVTIAAPFSIKDLSGATGVKGADIVKKLFMQGVMATINSAIDPEKAQEIMIDWDIELEVTQAKNAEQQVAEQFAERDRKDERPRGPIVTILGHVDHGKTSLLDRIRNANVAEGEAGGITQATSAFRVPVSEGAEAKHVTFIDTPGHEAFTAMRSRGANVTDIVVLVVAADDGVMPQTIESISHAKAAGVPIIVALNKIDKEQATDNNIQRILGQLAEHGLNPTDWGGDTEIVRTSAIKGTGIQDLLEILDLQAEVLELKSDFAGPAQGTVIEARPEGGRGNVANILVQEGKLSVGDFIVMGRAFGRVRDITDDRGQKHKVVLPPLPVQISGINDLPDAGDKFYCVASLKEAEKAADQRRDRERETTLAQPKLTLDNMFSQIADRDLQ